VPLPGEASVSRKIFSVYNIRYQLTLIRRFSACNKVAYLGLAPLELPGGVEGVLWETRAERLAHLRFWGTL
jgi:hypothetical protein